MHEFHGRSIEFIRTPVNVIDIVATASFYLDFITASFYMDFIMTSSFYLDFITASFYLDFIMTQLQQDHDVLEFVRCATSNLISTSAFHHRRHQHIG